MFLVGAPIFSARAQVVGYINLDISAGNNLIANQLDNGAGDYIDSVLVTGVATGSTFTEWNPLTQQFLPASIFNGSSWSIDYSFGPNGNGGMLNSPSNATVTLTGTVLYYDLATQTFNYTPPVRGPGVYLLADGPPRNDSTFQDIIGRAPLNGDWVETLDAVNQTYLVDTFENGAWDHGAPSLQTGEAAFFGLEVPVPEPSTLAIAASGLVFAAAWRWRGKVAKRGVRND